MDNEPTLVWDGALGKSTLVYDDDSLIWDAFIPPPETLGDLLMAKDDRARGLQVQSDRARSLEVKADRARHLQVMRSNRRP